MTRWVDCPICGETDMPFEAEKDMEDEGLGYITCLNLSCPSNSLVKVNNDRYELAELLVKWREWKSRHTPWIWGLACGVVIGIAIPIIY